MKLKKMGVVMTSVVLAVGLLALPTLAASSMNGGLQGQMRQLMNRTFSPAQHQQFMNTPSMQELHNSTEMQKAMSTSDVTKMQELMNSNAELKAQIGQDTIDKMNDLMTKAQQQGEGMLGTSTGNGMMGTQGSGMMGVRH